MRAARPLKTLEPLTRQVEAIIAFYGSVETAAERVGVDHTTLYDARRGERGFTTRTIRGIEEAFAVVQGLRRAGIGPDQYTPLSARATPPTPPIGQPDVMPERRPLLVQPVVRLEPISSRVRLPAAPVPRASLQDTPAGEQGRVLLAGTPTRACEVCERVLPLSDEHFYPKDHGGKRSWERICRRCSIRLRSRVQRVLGRERLLIEDLSGMEARPAPSLHPSTADAARQMLSAVSARFLDLAVEIERIDALLKEAEGG